MKHERSIVIDYETLSLKEKGRQFFRQSPQFLKNYFAGIFPILHWIHKYNLSWFVQDLIAGITVGIVIVPQSMAYAKIANLDPQYGLYSSFVGVTLYCFFGTSKDISVGPISTVSLLVGTVINYVAKLNPTISPAEIAVTLGLFTGIISIVISLLRLGILVDFIPEPAIAGYMTGSAITIILSQWPKLFGIQNVSTHAPPYKILGSILMKLPTTRLDVAFGLSSLVILYGIKFVCARFNCRSPALQKAVYLFGIMRNGLIVVVGTLIAYLISMGKEKSPVSVIQSVPAGFDAMGIPSLHVNILAEAGSILPSIVIILILEHITVSKSFGRIYDYQIDPNQEIFAIGVCNVVGSFFGGYCSTGAFSRTAIMARSGSRTPLAGMFSGAVLILALYALTPAFYYIPDAVLAAVVIHAVSDLASGSKYLKSLWKTSTAEFLVWICAVITTIFVDVQMGIYAAVGLSLAIMLLRIARPPVKVLSRIPINKDQDSTTDEMFLDKLGNKTVLDVSNDKDKHYLYVDEMDPNFQSHITELPSGLIVLKPGDSILYPNAEHVAEAIVHLAKSKTRCGNTEDLNKSDSEKPWNYSKATQDFDSMRLPILKAIIFDFGTVCRVDSTALQNLVTTRATLDRYAGHPVEWHFTGLQSQFVRSSLLNAGFGFYDQTNRSSISSSASSSVSSLVSLESANNHQASTSSNDKLPLKNIVVNNKSGLESTGNFIYETKMIENTSNISVNEIQAHTNYKQESRESHENTPSDRYPCFHWDVDSAVRTICTRWYNESQRYSQIAEEKQQA